MIIFLDFDGVIATQETYKSAITDFDLLDRKCIKVLNTLIRYLRADIVISSSWRVMHDEKTIREILFKSGLYPKAKILGFTPRDSSGDRGKEILRWIFDNKYSGDYMILDDEIKDITPYPLKNILHIKNGFTEGGLKFEHIIPYCTLPCPKCKGIMRMRQSDFGYYLVCEKYPNCDITHSVHKDTLLPMGKPADLLTRQMRMQAHDTFDKAWLKGNMSRNMAYKKIAKLMNMEESYCHIANFNVEQCKKLIEIIKKGEFV